MALLWRKDASKGNGWLSDFGMPRRDKLRCLNLKMSSVLPWAKTNSLHCSHSYKMWKYGCLVWPAVPCVHVSDSLLCTVNISSNSVGRGSIWQPIYWSQTNITLPWSFLFPDEKVGVKCCYKLQIHSSVSMGIWEKLSWAFYDQNIHNVVLFVIFSSKDCNFPAIICLFWDSPQNWIQSNHWTNISSIQC